MIFKREELEKMGISLVDEDGFDRDLVDIINEYEYKKVKDVIDSYEWKIPEPHYSKLKEAMYNYKVEIDD